MSSISITPNSTDDSAEKDPRPAGQRDRAAHAHLDPNDPAKDASGTPHYGTFGKADETEPPVSPKKDGSNDNPDEFSEFRKPNDAATEDYGTDADDANDVEQRGHITQNQAPDEVRAAHNADVDVQRAAWSADDPRYAGGHAKASWSEENNQEHDKN